MNFYMPGRKPNLKRWKSGQKKEEDEDEEKPKRGWGKEALDQGEKEEEERA